jgi:hypothetical protein
VDLTFALTLTIKAIFQVFLFKEKAEEDGSFAGVFTLYSQTGAEGRCGPPLCPSYVLF